MISKDNYDLAMYIIGRLMDEDPMPDTPSGQVLKELVLAVKEYEDNISGEF